MQTTSATWKALLAGGGAWLEAQALINGTAYTMMASPVISRALTQAGMAVGNAVSATCQLSIQTDAVIPRAAEVVVRVRLTDGTTTSEWLPAGTFYISRRTRDPVTGVLTLECYDALLKANAMMPDLLPWTTGSGEVMTTGDGEWLYFTATYPRRMADLAADLALVLGVEMDPRTQLATGSAYVIDSVEPGTTIHDVLARIAAANGGNWVVTPAGKLRLVPLVSAAGAASATANVIDVAAVTGEMSLQAAGTVTGVRYTAEDEPVVLGDETGIVIDADVGATIASALYDDLVGMTYQTYRLAGAVYDPAAELGDYVRGGANGEVSGVLYVEAATLGAAFRGDLSAPEADELSDEYPYIGASAKTLTAAKLYAATVADELDSSLDQQSVFNRLTDNGQAEGIYLSDGKLYINGSYIQAGQINADLITAGHLTANRIQGGTLTLGGQDNANGLLWVLNADGERIVVLHNGGIAVSNGVISVANTEGDRRLLLTDASLILASLVPASGSETPVWQTGFLLSNSIQSDNTMQNLISTKGNVYMWLDDTGEFILRSTANSTPKPRIQFDHTGTTVTGGITTDSINVGNGANGTFTTADGKTVTVTNGIITNIV